LERNARGGRLDLVPDYKTFLASSLTARQSKLERLPFKFFYR